MLWQNSGVNFYMLHKLGLELCEDCGEAVDEKFWEAHKGLCKRCYSEKNADIKEKDF